MKDKVKVFAFAGDLQVEGMGGNGSKESSNSPPLGDIKDGSPWFRRKTKSVLQACDGLEMDANLKYRNREKQRNVSDNSEGIGLVGPATKAYLAILRQPLPDYESVFKSTVEVKEREDPPVQQEGFEMEGSEAQIRRGIVVGTRVARISEDGAFENVGGSSGNECFVDGVSHQPSPTKCEPNRVQQAEERQPEQQFWDCLGGDDVENECQQKAEGGMESDYRVDCTAKEQLSWFVEENLDNLQDRNEGEGNEHVGDQRVEELDMEKGAGIWTNDRSTVYQGAARCRPAEVPVGALFVPISPNVTQRKKRNVASQSKSGKKRPRSDVDTHIDAFEENRPGKFQKF